MFLLAAAFASPAPAGFERWSWALRQAREQHADPHWRARLGADAAGIRVVVELEPGFELPGDLEVQAASPGAVQLWLSADQLERLDQIAVLPGVRRLRSPWQAEPKSELTEGYTATMLQDWHKLGLDGRGVYVGVVDVGFDNLAGLEGEAPDPEVLDESRGNPSSEHGTAVTEIIYDFAPGADYYLATFATDVELCAILDEMAAAGVQLVNGSIGFDNLWHPDGSSLLSQCVDNAALRGLTYVAAAGNEANKYRIGELSWGAEPGRLALGGVEELQVYSFFGEVDLRFRWSEPMAGAAVDVDLLVLNDDGSECGRSQEPQEGDGYPVEVVHVYGCSDSVTAYLTSEDDPSGVTGYFYAASGVPESLRTAGETLTLPGDAAGAVTVGAWSWFTDEVPSWSSEGPTYDGRVKPDVIAPTAVTTATYGYRRFDGTSAAAPHATGLAALYLEATRGGEGPIALKNWLKAEARDWGLPGPDRSSGSGVLTGEAPPVAPCGCRRGASSLVLGGPTLGGFWWLGRRRRRG